jgi:hypothetical protein
MHAFGIALDKGWFIVDYLLQTGETNALRVVATAGRSPIGDIGRTSPLRRSSNYLRLVSGNIEITAETFQTTDEVPSKSYLTQ